MTTEEEALEGDGADAALDTIRAECARLTMTARAAGNQDLSHLAALVSSLALLVKVFALEPADDNPNRTDRIERLRAGGFLVEDDDRDEVLFECGSCESTLVLLTDHADDLDTTDPPCPVCGSRMTLEFGA